MQIPFFFNTRSSSLLLNVLHLFCIYTFLHALSLQICNAADPIRPICNPNLYQTGSEFESNLNILLNNLVQHTSLSSGFNTSVSGQVPNRIYGLLQCRGDLSVKECYSCSQDAKTSTLQVCPKASGGRVWMEKCYIHYENYSFIGGLDKYFTTLPNVYNAPNPDTFPSTVKGLFNNLYDKASLSQKTFATGSIKDDLSKTIYDLVQCWRDISISDCKSCLTTAIFEQLFGVINETKLGEKSTKKTALVGGSLVMLLVGVALFAKRKKLKAAVFGRLIPLGREMEEDSLIREDRPTIFKLETLKNATGNFHKDNQLGEGGFGPVYKGTLTDGKEIAVKKLSLKSVQGKQEFLNEFKLLAKLQHKNLVQIFGCCADGSERLLVYEYLPNNSLAKLLFDPLLSKQLNWEMRFNIILGIARGLVYLHEDSRERIIHRDIKASNILLDQRMNPKIADFGLARLFVEDESHVSTRVAGTFGYMAPEYANGGQLSVKADVYSYGVLLLEIICGGKNSDFIISPEYQTLIELVWRAFERRQAVDVMDRRIVEECGEEEGVRCIHVGLLCTQANASLRPSMSSVYAMLSNPAMTNIPHPTIPGFVIITNGELRSHTATVSSRTASTSSSATPSVQTSVNDASVTPLVGK